MIVQWSCGIIHSFSGCKNSQKIKNPTGFHVCPWIIKLIRWRMKPTTLHLRYTSQTATFIHQITGKYTVRITIMQWLRKVSFQDFCIFIVACRCLAIEILSGQISINTTTIKKNQQITYPHNWFQQDQARSHCYSYSDSCHAGFHKSHWSKYQDPKHTH